MGIRSGPPGTSTFVDADATLSTPLPLVQFALVSGLDESGAA
jgi:hypothetical protein